MRSFFTRAAVVAALTVSVLQVGEAQQRRLNRHIDLVAKGQVTVGAGRPTPGRGGPAKTPAEVASDALDYRSADYYYDTSPSNDGLPGSKVDDALPALTDYMTALVKVGSERKIASVGFATPLIIGTPKFSTNPKAAADIGRLLNLGVGGLNILSPDNAAELQQALSAMRFKSKGGTRPDDVGMAPSVWGMSERDYKEKADLWPLNPNGELIAWAFIQTKPGLEHIREIAAVKGLGVIMVGERHLHAVFTSTNAAGEKVVDETGYEQGVQQILAACKEFHVVCGIPLQTKDLEPRIKQGFTVFFSMGGRPTIDEARKLGGRPPTND